MRLSPSRLLADLLTCLQSLSDLNPIMPFQLSLAAVASAVMGCDGCLASAAVGELVSEPSLGRGAGLGLQASLPDPRSPSRLFSIPSLFVPCHVSPSRLPPSHNTPSLSSLLPPSFVFWGIRQSRSRGMLVAASAGAPAPLLMAFPCWVVVGGIRSSQGHRRGSELGSFHQTLAVLPQTPQTLRQTVAPVVAVAATAGISGTLSKTPTPSGCNEGVKMIVE